MQWGKIYYMQTFEFIRIFAWLKILIIKYVKVFMVSLLENKILPSFHNFSRFEHSHLN